MNITPIGLNTNSYSTTKTAGKTDSNPSFGMNVADAGAILKPRVLAHLEHDPHGAESLENAIPKLKEILKKLGGNEDRFTLRVLVPSDSDEYIQSVCAMDSEKPGVAPISILTSLKPRTPSGGYILELTHALESFLEKIAVHTKIFAEREKAYDAAQRVSKKLDI